MKLCLYLMMCYVKVAEDESKGVVIRDSFGLIGVVGYLQTT